MNAKPKDGKKDVRLTYFLAIMMIVVGILSIQTVYGTSDIGFSGVMKALSKATLLIAGIFILIDPNKSNMRAIGIYAIALGVGRVFRSFPQLTSSSDVSFYIGLVLVAMGASLAYCGVSYLRGVSKNAERMKLITATLVLGYVVYIIYMVHWGQDFWQFFTQERDMMLMFMMYTIYILVLSSKDVYDNIPLVRMCTDTMSTRDAVSPVGSLTISNEDLDRMEHGLEDASSWDHPTGGPVESELHVALSSDSGSSSMIVQKWKGKDGLYITMVKDPDNSFIGVFRMHMTGIIRNDTGVELRDGNGMRVMLSVREVTEDGLE